MYIIDKFTSDTCKYFNKVFLWKRLEEDMQISRENCNLLKTSVCDQKMVFMLSPG